MKVIGNVGFLIILALACGLLAFVSTPTILVIEGEQARGFSDWCSSNAWIQMAPDVPQLELGSTIHPACKRDTTMALVRFLSTSLTVFLAGKMFLTRKKPLAQ